MSIHFDFVVSDVDAENIMSCISDAVLKCDMEIIKMFGKEDGDSYIKWFKERKEYLLNLSKKMKNTRMEDDLPKM